MWPKMSHGLYNVHGMDGCLFKGDGIKPNPAKVQCIANMPYTMDVQ